MSQAHMYKPDTQVFADFAHHVYSMLLGVTILVQLLCSQTPFDLCPSCQSGAVFEYLYSLEHILCMHVHMYMHILPWLVS